VISALSIFNDRENGNEHFLYGIETAKEIVENAPTVSDKPKRESKAMLPCKCGCKRREHWYAPSNKETPEFLKCMRCGFKVYGKNETDVIRKWNEAVKRDEDQQISNC
jgi:hypothetical protein